jgi:hypothetical protein
MDELGILSIQANTPQAKGRIVESASRKCQVHIARRRVTRH